MVTRLSSPCAQVIHDGSLASKALFELLIFSVLYLLFTDYVNKPSLNVFLKALDQPDVMDSTVVGISYYIIANCTVKWDWSLCYAISLG